MGWSPAGHRGELPYILRGHIWSLWGNMPYFSIGISHFIIWLGIGSNFIYWYTWALCTNIQWKMDYPPTVVWNQSKNLVGKTIGLLWGLFFCHRKLIVLPTWFNLQIQTSACRKTYFFGTFMQKTRVYYFLKFDPIFRPPYFPTENFHSFIILSSFHIIQYKVCILFYFLINISWLSMRIWYFLPFFDIFPSCSIWIYAFHPFSMIFNRNLRGRRGGWTYIRM